MTTHRAEVELRLTMGRQALSLRAQVDFEIRDGKCCSLVVQSLGVLNRLPSGVATRHVRCPVWLADFIRERCDRVEIMRSVKGFAS